jgi:hypothetical protein
MISFGLVSAARRFASTWLRILATGSASKRGSLTATRKRKEFERLIGIDRKRAEVAVEGICSGIERELDAQILEPCLEGAGIEVAGALVEQAGHEIGEAGLAFRILRRAAAERDVHGDDRDRIVLDQPGLDAGGARHLLNCRGP